MFDILKYKLDLNRLNRRKSKIDKFYSKIIKKENDQYEKNALIAEFHAEFVPIEFEIQYLISRYLINKSNKLMLSIPDKSKKNLWEDYNSFYTNNMLSLKGISFVRAQVRKEKKERAEQYIPWFALLVGLIGALTGLLSIILKD